MRASLEGVVGGILKCPPVTLHKSISLSVGGTCNLLLIRRIWQRQRDFADVIKVPKQLTLNRSQETLSWWAWPNQGHSLKEGVEIRDSFLLASKKQATRIPRL